MRSFVPKLYRPPELTAIFLFPVFLIFLAIAHCWMQYVLHVHDSLQMPESAYMCHVAVYDVVDSYKSLMEKVMK